MQTITCTCVATKCTEMVVGGAATR
jgi:hypothetical protein